MKRTTLRAFAIALLVVPLLATVGPAVAQDNNSTINGTAPYYDNQTTQVDNQSWMSGRENATLDNTFHFASRITTFVVGDGDQAADGPLLVGLFVLGAVLGVTVGSGVGIVGGGVLTVIALFGASAMDLAPGWLYPVALFGVGLLLAASFKRAIR